MHQPKHAGHQTGRVRGAQGAGRARVDPAQVRGAQGNGAGFGVRMSLEEFSTGDWIDRLARALPGLAEAQEPYLGEFWEWNPRVHVALGGRDGTPPAFPLGDVRILYQRARHSHVFGEAERYAPLCAVLDPVRHILISHPTLARVVGPIIGRDNFYMQILNAGGSTSPTDLIAGVMARAVELSGDRFRTAAGELNAFLASAGDEGSGSVLDGLDVGCDAVLFYGLTVAERIDVADGLAVLPFSQVRAFVDEELVEELAPSGAAFHGFRSVGVAVRIFRWRPALRRTGFDGALAPHDPRPLFGEARIFLELLAVAHARPVLRLAELSHCIDRSAGRLLGLERHNGGCHRGRSAQAFDGFEACPEVRHEGLAEAKEALESRTSERYARMAPVVGRLAEALARDGRFAVGDKILDVAIALERMYELDQGKISRQLRGRASRYLGTDGASQERIRAVVGEFYDARSDIVHNRLEKMTPQGNRVAFGKGFEIARRSLFQLLREGPPEDWNASRDAGS